MFIHFFLFYRSVWVLSLYDFKSRVVQYLDFLGEHTLFSCIDKLLI